MSNPKLRVKYLGLETKPLEFGLNKVESNPSSVMDEESTMLRRSLLRPLKKRENTFTVESRPINKKTIWNDKSLTSQPNTQDIRCLKKSPVESISNGKFSARSWMTLSKEKSKKLWLPIETGSVESHGNTSLGCVRSLEPLSWSTGTTITLPQKLNLPKTSSPSSTFSLVDTMVKGGNTQREELKKTMERTKTKQARMKAKRLEQELKIEKACKYIPSSREITLLPNVNQRKRLNNFISAVDKVWNVCNREINQDEKKVNEVELRNKFVIAKQMSPEIRKQLDWTLTTPKRVREYAVRDIVSAYKSGFTKLKKKQITHFTVKYKGRKREKHTIVLPHEGTYIKNGVLHVCGMDIRLKGNVEDCVVSSNMRCTRLGYSYHVNIPTFSLFKLKERETKTSIASIDLGIKIFATYYSPDFTWGEVGADVRNKLNSVYKKQEGIENNQNTTEKRRKRAIQKCKDKVVHLVDDFHWKATHWFLQRYGTILISRLYVPKSNTITKRHFNDLKHCLFVDRLEYKSMFYKGRVIHEGKEHYTSSVCTSCLSQNVEKSDTIKCIDCGFKIHRDLGGARNFLLKHLA